MPDNLSIIQFVIRKLILMYLGRTILIFNLGFVFNNTI